MTPGFAGGHLTCNAGEGAISCMGTAAIIGQRHALVSGERGMIAARDLM